MDEAQNAEPICEESYDDLDTVAEEAQNHLRNGMWSQGQDKYIQKEGALRALEVLPRPLPHSGTKLFTWKCLWGYLFRNTVKPPLNGHLGGSRKWLL